MGGRREWLWSTSVSAEVPLSFLPFLFPLQMNSIGLLQIQQPAPAWKGTAVVDGSFKEIALSDYKGKYLVFFFYPLDFTFVCPTEIIAFSDRIDEFRAIGCEVVACSTDSHFCHFAWYVRYSEKLLHAIDNEGYSC